MPDQNTHNQQSISVNLIVSLSVLGGRPAHCSAISRPDQYSVTDIGSWRLHHRGIRQLYRSYSRPSRRRKYWSFCPRIFSRTIQYRHRYEKLRGTIPLGGIVTAPKTLLGAVGY